MWAGPKKGDKIGDRIREEAGLDRERFSGLARAVYGLSLVMERVSKHITFTFYTVFFDIFPIKNYLVMK